MRRIFLDHNSTTPPLPEVVETVKQHLAESYANPGSRHAEGRIARRVLEDARERIAALLGAEPAEVIFTSGGTESINLAILGLASRERGTVVLTRGEHPATRNASRRLQQRGWKPAYLEVDSQGRVDQKSIDSVAWDEVQLTTLVLANNETGVIQEPASLAARCRQMGVPLHLDAVQAVGKMPVNFASLEGTALSLAAHKFGGPRGIGALLLKQRVPFRPRQVGGHQESGRRAGTEPVALAAGMAVALERWHAEGAHERQRLRTLRDRFEREIVQRCPIAIIHSLHAPRLGNTSNIGFPGLDGEALQVSLDLEGIACSLGTTCASGSAEPSPILVAMGCSPEVVRSSIRFSLGWQTTDDDIDEAVERIGRCVRRLLGPGGESKRLARENRLPVS